MLKVINILIVLLILVTQNLAGQTTNYFVQKAGFSTDKFDEFSPAFYRKGLVFCSNQGSGIFSGYTTPDNKGFFRIHYADTAGGQRLRESQPLPGDVNSNLNNGPATFSPGGDTVYFSRNLIVEGSYKDISSTRNKLGLFYSVFSGGKWGEVTEMRFNDYTHNVTTPCLSPDGRKLYFASDRSDGYGGSDIYYSEWRKGYWDNPVNLGPVINTTGNEAYPFINENGDLFFSSDKHPGLGGKDIFYSRFVDTAWLAPINLSPPVNSKNNDFGFIADNTLSGGYFSSDRNSSLDIFSFRTIFPQMFYCVKQENVNYCFRFNDDTGIETDPSSMQLQWDFGDGKKATGPVSEHCYPGPGKYIVQQNVIDKKRSQVIFNILKLELELKEGILPAIKAPETTVAGEPVRIIAESMPGYEVYSWFWDFGDKSTAKGVTVDHTFSEPGEFNVNLTADMKEVSSGKTRRVCVSKTVRITSKPVKQTGQASGNAIQYTDIDDVINRGNIFLTRIYSARAAIEDKAVFRVEIHQSVEELKTNDRLFGNIVPQYYVRKVFNNSDSVYSYIISEEADFMSAMPAYRDAVSSGYRNARIVTYIPEEQAEKELWNFKRTYGTSSDYYFVNYGASIAPRAVDALDQLVLLLKRNPGLRLIVEAHSDETGSVANSLSVTRRQAQNIVDYLVGLGIGKDRLIASGLGSSRPVAPGDSGSESKRNWRIDLVKIDQNE